MRRDFRREEEEGSACQYWGPSAQESWQNLTPFLSRHCLSKRMEILCLDTVHYFLFNENLCLCAIQLLFSFFLFLCCPACGEGLKWPAPSIQRCHVWYSLLVPATKMICVCNIWQIKKFCMTACLCHFLVLLKS